MFQTRPVLLLLVAVLLGCDTTAPQPESQVVVESYLRAEAPLPTVRLSRTIGVDDAYDPTENAVRDADVVVERLAAETDVDLPEIDAIPTDDEET